MNFPDTQRTGALAEIDVERLFLSWSWNVGHDRIDAGYDLCVTPERGKYKGARFLVQVKGTAQRKRKDTIVAPVSKARLRQYAVDVMPVFLVRATADGALYWRHAQPWAHLHRDRLRGSGNSGVRFDPVHRLIDRAAFEAYLAQVLPSATGEAFTDLVGESRFLNSLDPRLGVRLSARNNAKTHEIFATSQDVDSQFTFRPMPSAQNLESLREAIEFGLPRSIEVENFALTGSPLFAHVGANGPNKGTLTINQTSRQSGAVRLFPGHQYSITAAEIALDADLFTGQKGAAITNELRESVCDLSIRLVPLLNSDQATVNIGIRSSALTGRPIQHIDALRPLAAWSEQVATQGSMFLELSFNGGRAPLVAAGEVLDRLRPLLHWGRTLSRLHQVAKVLGSTLTLPPDVEFSAEDLGDIDLAYALLKGERRPIGLGPIEFLPVQSLDGISNGKFYCTTTLSLALLDQPLGDIPVVIELSDYVLEAMPDCRVRLDKGERGQAWISYAEHGDSDSWITQART